MAHIHNFGNAQKQPTRQLIGFSAFWKNDKPGGIGIHMSQDHYTPAQLEQMFGEAALNKYMASAIEFYGSKEAAIKGTIEQMDEWCKENITNPMDINTLYYAALNIAFLTEVGAMPNDNFNGSQYQWSLLFQ